MSSMLDFTCLSTIDSFDHLSSPEQSLSWPWYTVKFANAAHPGSASHFQTFYLLCLLLQLVVSQNCHTIFIELLVLVLSPILSVHHLHSRGLMSLQMCFISQQSLLFCFKLKTLGWTCTTPCPTQHPSCLKSYCFTYITSLAPKVSAFSSPVCDSAPLVFQGYFFDCMLLCSKTLMALCCVQNQIYTVS